MKWKYTQDKPKRNFDLFLRIPESKDKCITITGWRFEKAPNGSLFKCEVIEEDGKPVDKFWSVWDFDLREALKARLKGKKPDRTKVQLIVKKKTREGDEVFELK